MCRAESSSWLSQQNAALWSDDWASEQVLIKGGARKHYAVMTAEFGQSPFLYPDPLTDSTALSGAVFLYFDEPIVVTSPPLLVLERPLGLIRMIGDRRPKWGPLFLFLFDTWQQRKRQALRTREELAVLRDRLINVWMIYPSDSDALQRASDMARASGLTNAQIFEVIDPRNAAGELMRHILLEQYLTVGENLEELFSYTQSLLEGGPIEDILVPAYMLRMSLFNGSGKAPARVLLSGPLVPLLEALAVAPEDNVPSLDSDVVSWEIFRQVLSPRIDPLGPSTARVIRSILDSRHDEVQRLKRKCEIAAYELKAPGGMDELTKDVSRFIRLHLEEEIRAVLNLDKRNWEDFFTVLLSDKETWLAFSATIASLVHGQAVVTAGAAVASLSMVGSKAVATAAAQRKELRTSDLSLLYHVGRLRTKETA